MKNRIILQNNILCADSFINNFIGSKYNLNFINNNYIFNRNLYFMDDYRCEIENINIVQVDMDIKNIFFISGDFAFEYKLVNSFVYFIKSFNLF